MPRTFSVSDGCTAFVKRVAQTAQALRKPGNIHASNNLSDHRAAGIVRQPRHINPKSRPQW